MKNYDEMLDDFILKAKDKISDLWCNVLDFIFDTKVGHMIFMMIPSIVILGLASLFFAPERRLSILVGAFVGSFVTALYYAWKDDNETWV